MIAQLRGKIIEKNPTDLVIECGGVGYELRVSLNTSIALDESKDAIIFTQLIVREDAQILYGFFDKEERVMFNHLISEIGRAHV